MNSKNYFRIMLFLETS